MLKAMKSRIVGEVEQHLALISFERLDNVKGVSIREYSAID